MGGLRGPRRRGGRAGEGEEVRLAPAEARTVISCVCLRKRAPVWFLSEYWRSKRLDVQRRVNESKHESSGSSLKSKIPVREGCPLLHLLFWAPEGSDWCTARGGGVRGDVLPLGFSTLHTWAPPAPNTWMRQCPQLE